MTHMKYLEIAYDVVQDELTEMEKTNQSVYSNMRKCLENMSKSWSSKQYIRIPYYNSLYRVSYVYAHFAADASLIESGFHRDKTLAGFYDQVHSSKGKVRICVFGAGPGPEVVGITNWIRRRGLKHLSYTDYTLFDREPGWQILAERVISKANAATDPLEKSVKVSCHFRYAKGFDLTAFNGVEDCYGHDIYVFSYVLSEIRGSNVPQILEAFGAGLRDGISDAAKFVFIDRFNVRENHPIENAVAICRGLAIVLEPSSVLPDKMPTTEWQVTETQRFRNLSRALGRRSPRGNSNTREAFFMTATANGDSVSL